LTGGQRHIGIVLAVTDTDDDWWCQWRWDVMSVVSGWSNVVWSCSCSGDHVIVSSRECSALHVDIIVLCQ